MNLPNDYARCPGTTRPECFGCRRKEPVSSDAAYAVMIPAAIRDDGFCPNRITSVVVAEDLEAL